MNYKRYNLLIKPSLTAGYQTCWTTIDEKTFNNLKQEYTHWLKEYTFIDKKQAAKQLYDFAITKLIYNKNKRYIQFLPIK